MLATFGVTDRRRLSAPARRGDVDRQRAVRSGRDAAPGPGARRQPDRARRAGDRRRLRRHARRHRPRRRGGAAARDRAPARRITTRSSSRAARRSGPRTCRPTRSPISNRPASCSTASTSGPGKPTLFARAGGKPVVGMPGFPTSSLIVFDAFIRPMLWRLGGEAARDPWPSRRAGAHQPRAPVGRRPRGLPARARSSSATAAPGPTRCRAARRRCPTSCSPTAWCASTPQRRAGRRATRSKSCCTDAGPRIDHRPSCRTGPPA